MVDRLFGLTLAPITAAATAESGVVHNVDSTTVAFALTLPDITARTKPIFVMDVGANLATNNVTLTAHASDTVGGAATFALTANSGAWILTPNTGSNNWKVDSLGSAGAVSEVIVEAVRPGSPAAGQLVSVQVGPPVVVSYWNGASWASADTGYLPDRLGAVQTANVTVLGNETVRTSTAGGAFTVTLPDIAAATGPVKILDVAGSWGTNDLTVAADATDTIEGAATVDLSTDYESVVFHPDAANNVWVRAGEGDVIVTAASGAVGRQAGFYTDALVAIDAGAALFTDATATPADYPQGWRQYVINTGRGDEHYIRDRDTAGTAIWTQI